MAGTYVYAIIPTRDQMIFDDVAGVDEDHDEVYAIPYDGVAAVVSDSPLADYRGLKRDQAVRYLVDHQRVVEAVMQAFPVLPLKFGTALPDEEGVRQLLRQGDTLFRSALEKLAGLVQMEVVVLWELQEVFAEIAQEEHIARLRDQVAGRPAEETMAERVAIGQMVHVALEQHRGGLQSHLIPSLREVARDLVINPLMDDSMVLNVALLVDRVGREALEHSLDRLDEEFEGQLLFRCVGPLPPYSFATVEVKVPSFEAVDQARRCLGLGEKATYDEVRQAYHRLASQAHPDHNPGNSEAGARMTELTRAHELLIAYVGSQAWAQEGSGTDDQRPTTDDRRPTTNDRRPTTNDQRPMTNDYPGSSFVLRPSSLCDFSRQAVERTLLIAIQRQEG